MGYRSLVISLLLLFVMGMFNPIRASCLPSYKSLELSKRLSLKESYYLKKPLISKNHQYEFETPVILELSHKTLSQNLKMVIKFDEDFEGVSLPYNLYVIMVVQDNEIIASYDFTNHCEAPGISFFPGEVIEFTPIGLSNKKESLIEVIIWGRL